jgi:two-component system, LytTR family, sensor kinase
MPEATHGSGHRVHSAALTVAAVYLLFTIIGLVEGTQGWIGARTGYFQFTGYTYRGGGARWIDFVARQTVSWWVFATFVLATIALASRFPIQPGRWRPTVLFHFGVSLLFPVFSLGTAVALRYLLFIRHEVAVSYGTLFGRALALYYSLYMLYYWAIVGVSSAFQYYQLYRERALGEARLERDLSDAHLSALQAQLQPHFLFNTLNAVCGYALERNHEAVVAMLTRLSDLLRAVLSRRSSHTIPLGEEMRTLESYIELQRLRLGDRLAVEVLVESDALSAEVPPLLLQPIVENAIEHGVCRVPGGGLVQVSARRRNGVVEVTVADNGPGFPADAGAGIPQGLGLSATVERLRLMYGGTCRVETSGRPGGGAVVRVRFPYVATLNLCPAEEHERQDPNDHRR